MYLQLQLPFKNNTNQKCVAKPSVQPARRHSVAPQRILIKCIQQLITSVPNSPALQRTQLNQALSMIKLSTHHACHTTSYVLNSRVTELKLTNLLHNVQKCLPTNMLKSKLRLLRVLWVLVTNFTCFTPAFSCNYNLPVLTCILSWISDFSSVAYLFVCMYANCGSVACTSGQRAAAGINLYDYLYVCK